MRNFAFFIALVLLALAYQAHFLLPQQQFLGFTPLKWSTTDRCVETISNIGGALHVRNLTLTASSTDVPVVCVSEWFEAQGNYLAVELAGEAGSRNRPSGRLVVEGEGSVVLGTLPLPPPHAWGSNLRRVRFEQAPRDNHRLRLRLSLAPPARGQAAFSVLSKVSFLQVDRSFSERRAETRPAVNWHDASRALLSLAFGLTAVFALANSSSFFRFAVYLLFAIAVHFRLDGFFYLDDWQYLERIAEAGWTQVWKVQNEHFIPVFSTLFQLQFEIFGTNYWAYTLVAIGVHTVNALLLESFLNRLTTLFAHTSLPVSRFLAFTYLVSGFHAEVLQWLTCSSTVWAIFARLIAYNFSWDYFREGKRTSLTVAVLATVAGPLVFGGNFAVIIELLILAILVRAATPGRCAPPAFFRRGLVLFGIVSTLMCGELILYKLSPSTNGVSLEEATIPTIAEAIRYTLLGSQFGAFYRGFSLGTGLQFSDYKNFWNFQPLQQFPLDIRLGLAGCVSSMTVLGIYLRLAASRRAALSIFCLGQTVAILPFALSAFIRLRYGMEYAFHLRYYSVAYLGVVIAVFPLVTHVVSLHPDRSRTASKLLKLTAVVLFSLYFSRSISLSEQYSAFQVAGQNEKLFYQQVLDWNHRLHRQPGYEATSYEGVNTHLEGLQPNRYLALTHDIDILVHPPRHPDRYYRFIESIPKHPNGA